MSASDRPAALATGAGEFLWPVRVYYEDTDAIGVVYHAAYLRFMERARTEWLRARGFEQDTLRAAGVVFPVRRIDVHYLRPARFNERLQVSVAVASAGRVGLHLRQAVRRADGAEVARAAVEVVCVDPDSFRPRRIPAHIHAELLHAG